MQRAHTRPGMGQKFVAGFLLAGTLLIAAGAFSDLQAGGKKSDSEVKITASATKLDADGKQVVTVTLAINKGWHLYANPVGNPDLNDNRTEVKVKAKVDPEQVKVTYPPGKLTKDKLIGDYKIYEGTIKIQAAVQRAQGDTSPLEVAVKLVACHEKGVCLLPATVKVAVK